MAYTVSGYLRAYRVQYNSQVDCTVTARSRAYGGNYIRPCYTRDVSQPYAVYIRKEIAHDMLRLHYDGVAKYLNTSMVSVLYVMNRYVSES